MIYFTKNSGRTVVDIAMAQKTYPNSFDPQRDLTTDYALIATGVGAALIALIYLILI